MRTVIFLVASLFLAPASAHEPALTTQVFPSAVGLVLIGVTQNGIAIGADSASSNADGTISQTQKIFAIGKNGAVAVAGAVSLQDPVTRPVREEVNVARIISVWLDTHPDATFDDAQKEITREIVRATTKYFSTRAPASASRRYRFALIFAGVVDSKPVIHAVKYYMPLAKGRAMRAEPVGGHANTSQVWAFGQDQVERALLDGAPASLDKFRTEPSIKKLLSSRSADRSLQDYLNAFDTILRATESPQGKKLLAGKPAVVPPNKLAQVTKDGFIWAPAK